MTEQPPPPPLPSRKLWSEVNALYAALRRTAPNVGAEPALGEVAATGPAPFLRVKYQWLGPYRVRFRNGEYVVDSGQYEGKTLGPDAEQAARKLAELLNAPVHEPAP
ncbi:hypothetical protein [Actinomadura opuntiae]|uniref:hypothetical protein n=1 Tax=Actinomadura sp. OS1-43 TaxID=604315 RepID=UPI00255AC371|nr:hypothetical protein [Actinomadura sp. OS1-43]MDL4812839.1 hypothetical protein [Actinomadura sp. OS1-43]